MKEALVLLITAWRKAMHLDSTLISAGYSETPYFDIAARIADSIYLMLGEKTDTFGESVTCHVLSDLSLTDEQAAEVFSARLVQ